MGVFSVTFSPAFAGAGDARRRPVPTMDRQPGLGPVDQLLGGGDAQQDAAAEGHVALGHSALKFGPSAPALAAEGSRREVEDRLAVVSFIQPTSFRHP